MLQDTTKKGIFQARFDCLFFEDAWFTGFLLFCGKLGMCPFKALTISFIFATISIIEGSYMFEVIAVGIVQDSWFVPVVFKGNEVVTVLESQVL